MRLDGLSLFLLGFACLGTEACDPPANARVAHSLRGVSSVFRQADASAFSIEKVGRAQRIRLPGGAIATTLTVVVSQSDDSPIADADVVFVPASGRATSIARTDSSGRVEIAFPDDAGFPATIVVRKIGYATQRRTIAQRDVGPIVRIALSSVTAIDTVRVRAERLGSRDYLLTARDITSSNRTIRSLYEALGKLRPQMLGDSYRCPRDPVTNVWINGRRVFFTLTPMNTGRNVRVIGVPSVARSGGESTVESILASVKPEHVSEVRYQNCWDTSMAGIGTDNAVYVVLVPGASWNLRDGSYMVNSP